MKISDFTIRTANWNTDCARLESLFDAVFLPEQVGKFASTLFQHHPESNHACWFMAEHKRSGQLAAAFTLIPWHWTWFGKDITVAEQGVVATLPEFRGLGLQRRLNAAFDEELKTRAADLAIIQGIPGFYHTFDYYYALPIDNHINLEWRQIPDAAFNKLKFRQAKLSDVAFLMAQEQSAAQIFDSTNTRDEKTWQYLLTHSKETEYGSDVWIGENNGAPQVFFRRNYTGFGDGMIISEASECLTYSQALEILSFLKQLNADIQKPYLRLNLSNDASLSRVAFQLGAPKGEPYGFQIKIVDHRRWLEKQSELFTNRLKHSALKDFTGVLRLDLFRQAIDIAFDNGHCRHVTNANEHETTSANVCIPLNLAPALFLGRHSWRELRKTRPDLICDNPIGKIFMDTLFPKITSWHPLPY